MKNMYLNIIPNFTESFIDYPDDESLCITVYIVGCEHNCKNCHNKELQDYNTKSATRLLVEDVICRIEKSCEQNFTNKVVLQGGDPLFGKNIEQVKELLTLLYNKNYDVCVYTGYDIEYVKQNNIKNFKFIKTGKYNENLNQISEKTDEYFQLASKNQKIFDANFNLLSEDGRFYF